MTILEALSKATEILRENKISNPHSTAEIFLFSILNLKRVDLYLNKDKILTQPENEKLNSYLQQRISGKPIQYVTGEVGFFGFEFKIDPRAMIPRPETEVLVSEIVEQFKKTKKEFDPLRIIDTGTGSGVIAITLAKELANSIIYATDISKDALELAKENAERNDVEQRIEFVYGDLFKPLKEKNVENSIDCIVSNPPYVKDSELGKLDKEIRDFEPKVALLSGEDGIGFHEKITEGAVAYLKSGGLLALEVGLGDAERLAQFISSNRQDVVKTLRASHNSYENIKIVKDLAGIKRVVLGTKK
jgi:release factor glutamine methyltransferase